MYLKLFLFECRKKMDVDSPFFLLFIFPSFVLEEHSCVLRREDAMKNGLMHFSFILTIDHDFLFFTACVYSASRAICSTSIFFFEQRINRFFFIIEWDASSFGRTFSFKECLGIVLQQEFDRNISADSESKICICVGRVD